MRHKNYITFVFCSLSFFAYSGVETKKTPAPSESEPRLNELVTQEQQELARLIADEQEALNQKKEFAKDKMIQKLWQKYGSMNDCIKTLYSLIKPISDNNQSNQCLGGHERLLHFIKLYEQLFDIHKNISLTDLQRKTRIKVITDEARWASSEYDQALEKSDFDFSSCTVNHDEAKEFLALLKSGDTYAVLGTNFTCGALLNVGFGGGCGLRTTPLGERNCALMSESNFSIGCPQLACTKISSNQRSFSFIASDPDLQNSNGEHIGLICAGTTSAKKPGSSVFELLFCSPISVMKAGTVGFFNASPQQTDFAQFQQNLGFTLATCCPTLPEIYEQQIQQANSVQEVDGVIKQFMANY